MLKNLLIFVNKFDENDDLLGFFPGWVYELAKQLKIIVITQKIGQYRDLPNLKVILLDKEKYGSPAVRILKLNNLLFSFKKEYDAILVIMAPAWVIVSALAAKILKKKLYLWYAVWRGNWKLRLAERLADKIFCSVEESFPFKSNKVFAIGQGIDTDKLFPDIHLIRPNSILYLGRISPVKKIELIFRALRIIKDKDTHSFGLIRDIIIAGDGASEKDRLYLDSLKKTVTEMDLSSKIAWKGRIPHGRVLDQYHQGDIFVSATPTGSFDKAMLEAMACGNIVITSNLALLRYLSPELAGKIVFKEDDVADLAKKITYVLNLGAEDKNLIRKQLREMIIQNHSQNQWAEKLIKNI